jgi:hypothetical protein
MWGHVRLRKYIATSPLKSPIGGQCSNLSTKLRNLVALGAGTIPIGGNFIRDPYSLIFAMKPIPRRLGWGSFIRLRIKHHLEMPIVLVLQCHEFVRQILVRRDCLSQANKRPHDQSSRSSHRVG